MSIRTWALGGAAALALTLGPATAAFAGGTPTPVPTTNFGLPSPLDCSRDVRVPPPVPYPAATNTAPGYGSPTDAPSLTANFGYGDHRDHRDHKARCLPEQFRVVLSDLNPGGDVHAVGPIRFLHGRDFTISPVQDRFRQFFPFFRSVRVNHPDLPLPTVDRTTCSIEFSALDQPWTILRGTGSGLYRFASGHGKYSLEADFQFPIDPVTGACSLPALLSPVQARTDIDTNSGLPAPFGYGIVVTGTGVAAAR